ncbi:CDP-diacylglycerol--glycerol-3-phosphate 3-phosphatidyltransferase [Arsenophonus endosymbiont of Aleurodicus dispersus]|uniref:CDP-diacylglycerol--glycerol-3-phosphate 3-phosphatidyltransferase n=1 Tax=Arsenophonus endosymbiont of Aleurodicus dispersus TaxID=235559 RepID=UPI000EAE6D19|nr:CDP-diacylglycerol--glycerol-3-phosphate 3-phosphatidyltransferase [Arsenophonus endosymbiont of Aleurodicus dispersus]VAY02310.1 CDP-diacylglycerol--glycerol-3-phosphate 3-phosphatidyltransferase [Arsenophonus endosymbiont of Aleurodicus dispersus]
MQLNIPTWLTIFRIILIPFFILFFYIPFYWAHFICAFLFIIAALTDWLDGFLARLWQQTTKFGTFLDPVADKIMVITALVLVTEYYHSWWGTLPTVTMIAREIIISSLREWMARVGTRSCIVVSWIGKFKTTTQMISLVGLLWHPNIQIEIIAIILLYFSAILTFWSMFKYLSRAWKNLNTA